MSVLLISIVILVILWILGVSKVMLLSAVYVMMLLVVASSFIVFIIANIRLIGAVRVEAKFSRREKHHWGSFDQVFYTIDGEEYPNIFPGEVAFKDLLYKEDATVNVLVTKGNKPVVFDKNAELCARIGIVVSSIMLIGGVMLAIQMFYPYF